jgi:hypothetical protein
VAAALDGDREIIFPGEVHGTANILGVGGADNDVRTAVNHRIEDLPGVVVAGVSGPQQPAPERRTQAIDGGWVKRRCGGPESHDTAPFSFEIVEDARRPAASRSFDRQ